MKFDSDRKRLFKYFRYFFTLLLVATLSLAGLQYFYADSLMQRDAAANSRNMFSLLKQSHDTFFTQMERSLSGMMNGKQFQYFMDYYRQGQVRKTIEIYEQLLAITRSMEGIQNICLYYPADDFTLSTNQSVSTLELYHARDFLESLKNIDLFRLYQHRTFVRKVYYALAANPTDVVSIVRTLPTVVLSGAPEAYVIIDIQMSAISAAFEEVTISNNASLMIFDEIGEPISVTGRAYRMDDLLGQSPTPSYGISFNRVKIGPDDLFVYHTTSADMGWTYVYAQNASEFNGKLYLMRNTSIVLCLGVLVLGLLYAWIAAQKLYRPIKQISDQLGNQDVDVFDRIDEVVARNEQLDQTLQENVITGRNHQLLQRMLMNFDADADLGGQLKLQKEERECALYLLGTDTDRDELSQDSLAKALYPFGMRPLIKLYAGEGEIACIVATETFSTDTMRASAKAILAASAQCGGMSIGISHAFASASQLSDAYRQARDALGMRLVRGPGSVCCFREIRNRPSLDYPFKIENAVLRAFKTFDEENVRRELSGFEEYLTQNDASAQTVCDFYTQLFCSFQRLMLELPVNTGSAAAFSHRDMLKMTAISDMSDYMMEFFHALIGSREKTDVKSEVIDRVCAFIQAHLEEAPTAEGIAAEFFMSVSTLRMEFQRAKGISIKNYTDQVRIQVAKDMLRDGDIKIQDIARRLGFNYAQSFIAFFKGATGMTPGEYRSREQLRRLEDKQEQGAG